MNIKEPDFKVLADILEGELFTDEATKIMYSTDASAYKEKPLAVARPKNKYDIKKIIDFARKHKTTIIPRAAGTSLAGQVVGNGIVVDISRYMTSILEFHKEEKWIRVEPGVILEELNLFLKPHGLMFGPETSTANRCMISGMLGNNACGLHSLIYGSTREHTLEAKAILSDGTEAVFGPLDNEGFQNKCKGNSLENKIYQDINDILNKPENQKNIRETYPDKTLKRRNTGYAIDLLLETTPFSNNNEPFNFCKLIAGSEGTLAFITEIKLNLVPLPPPEKALACIHLDTIKDALRANLIALEYKPDAIELMDHKILELTKKSHGQQKNRFFIKGDPGAILIVEFSKNSRKEIQDIVKKMEKSMSEQGYGFHFPIVFGDDIKKVWNLRKAGLGVLSNMQGDARPVSVIEDTSVDPAKLPDYIDDFNKILEKHNLECVYHAHIATGELHLRPILNLKDEKDVEMFHTIAFETAQLVKKYKGSLSGEHGDGRLRGEFIPLMVGEDNFKLLRRIKETWDPDHLFNYGKIIDTPKMNTSLRYQPGTETKKIETIFDFSDAGDIIRAAEKCNGSGDCRKTEVIGGTMCPSYMATRDENHVTRARANVLREYISNSSKKNPFDHKEIYEVMDLCLSCKACKSECPSNVDVAKLKAEFLQHYYDVHGVPLRSRVIANITAINSLGMLFPSLFNLFMGSALRKPFMNLLGFEPKRKLPLLQKKTLAKWMKQYVSKLQPIQSYKKRVYLFNDEFTNYNDTDIGIKAIQLLNKLGYEVIIPKHLLSSRTYLSKGLVRKAAKIANQNISLLKDVIKEKVPLIGIEPSAILTFRDEYPELVKDSLKEAANAISKNTFLFDEFIANEIDNNNILKEQFTQKEQKILLHGHCQQKAVASTDCTIKILSFPENFDAEEIPSGCCGMAGAFGYEKEHYEVSMKVGELVLFPAVRNASKETIIAAPGTSCRHQIKDGTGRKAFHPIEILWDALK